MAQLRDWLNGCIQEQRTREWCGSNHVVVRLALVVQQIGVDLDSARRIWKTQIVQSKGHDRGGARAGKLTVVLDGAIWMTSRIFVLWVRKQVRQTEKDIIHKSRAEANLRRLVWTTRRLDEQLFGVCQACDLGVDADNIEFVGCAMGWQQMARSAMDKPLSERKVKRQAMEDPILNDTNLLQEINREWC